MHLTENMIVARSKHSDLTAIKRINLWGCELTDISIVRNMTNIEVLALSVNNLSSLKPLENCKKLQELYLRKNNIQDFKELTHLQNLPVLSHLWLAENPCCVNVGDNYRAYVVKMLPNLKKLDEEMITAADIEAAKKIDCSVAELARPTCNMLIDKEMPKNSPESHFISSPSTIMQQSNTPPQSSQQLDAGKQSLDCNLMQQRSQTSFNDKGMQLESSPLNKEIPDLTSISPCLPELNLSQQNLYSTGANSISQHFDELQSQSPNKSVLSQHSNDADHRAEKTDANFKVPLSPFTARSESEHSSPKEVQFLNRTHSLNQIPQLNFVVQIHQSQPGLEIPLQIPRSISLQTINECSDHNDEQPEQHYQEYGAAGDQTARSNYQVLPEVSPENISHTNTARKSQGYQNMLGFEMATQTPRSRYTMGVNNNNNNTGWEDGYQNSARSTSTLTTASRSARRHNANVLSALLCIVPELDIESLQVLDHSIQCRMDELSLE